MKAKLDAQLKAESLAAIQQLQQVTAVAHMVINGLVGESSTELLELVHSVIRGEANLKAQRGEPMTMEDVARHVSETVASFKLSMSETEEVPNA